MTTTELSDAREPVPTWAPLPPVDVTPKSALSNKIRLGFAQACEAAHTLACREYDAYLARSPGTTVGLRPNPISSEEQDSIFLLLANPEPWQTVPWGLGGSPWHLEPQIADLVLDHDEIAPLHVVRYVHLTVGLARNVSTKAVELDRHGREPLSSMLDRYQRRHGRYDLRTVGHALEYCGLRASDLARCELVERVMFDWEAERIWPLYAEHLDLLLRLFGIGMPAPNPGFGVSRDEVLARAFKIIASFPTPPEALREPLWQLSIGPASTTRKGAQACYARFPDRDARLLTALTDKRREVRAEAASWLSALGKVEHTPALHKALATEKHPLTYVRLVDALLRLGEAPERILDRERLLSDAQKGTVAGIPEALVWLPWADLPRVHFRDGTLVDPAILTFWLIQAHKQKSPEAGGFSAYAHVLDRAEAERFGEWVFDSWLAEDCKGDGVRRGHLDNAPGCAIAHKGLLALTSAFAGAPIVPKVREYLHTFYGWRAAQCKALVAMLSCIEHPSAVQLLLATAARFRTPGIRSEAEEQVRALAEGKGWTVDDLADRSMPAADLDDDGTLTVRYLHESPIEAESVSRSFVLRLQDDLTVRIHDESGEARDKLPEPRKGEDAASAKRASQQLSQVKKKLKELVTQQHERLFSAMCTGRLWPSSDFRRYLWDHPVMGRLCVRLVWTECDREGVPRRHFRLLSDGSLTSVDDESVELREDAWVRLAHGSLMSEAEARAWRTHLDDFEVTPLFAQLDRPAHTLAADEADAVSIARFAGHMISAFKLRSVAKKLAYTRGRTEDGGWFSSYEKRFVGLGIDAVILFSGNRLPEEDRTVALRALEFRRTDADDSSRARVLRLKDVPSILLSECFHDLADMAAAGSGFDPGWQSRI